jgi:hypothetical protein
MAQDHSAIEQGNQLEHVQAVVLREVENMDSAESDEVWSRQSDETG